AYFGRSENNRNLCGTFRPLNVIDEVELSIEHLLVKKQQRAESLVLGGRSDILLNREITKKGADFFFAHFVWMAFSMEENEPANPIDVNFFRSNGIAFRAQLPANAIKQLRRGSNNRIRGGHASDDVRWKRHGKAKKSTAG